MESKNWDGIAIDYVKQRPVSYATMIEEPIIRKMLGNVKGKKVLDAGCAGGYFSGILDYMGAEVTAIDISENMLLYAGKNNVGKNIEFKKLDIAKQLPFEDQEFDTVLASLLFNNVGDYPAAVRNIHRILKPGGDFIFSIEHPILTSGEYSDIYPKIIDYFTERYVMRHWTILGKETNWETIHRPISAYLNPLFQVGFKVEEIVEPEPPLKLREVNQEIYNKRKVAPVFLIVHSKK